ncbi:hypothetical protein ABK040_007101 [Willaertia magna]
MIANEHKEDEQPIDEKTFQQLVTKEMIQSQLDSNDTNSKPNCSNNTIDYSKLGPNSFNKIKLIGKGDVGKVYLVNLKDRPDLYFAMKVMKKEDMIKRNKVKRVLTEREILATMDHPFIASLFCSFQSKDRIYFILEYCSGGEFFHFLKRQPGKCLPEATVAFYVAEILLALEYLHLLGFIYRDLKPENILIHHSGHIRLTDFDLSKQSAQPLNPTLVKSFFQSQDKSKLEIKQLQEFNSFVGTCEYLSPEIIQGTGHNMTVDFWCCGILLYEMLFGCTPFKGTTQRDTFYNIINGKFTFPSKTMYPVSKNAKDLITKLLIQDKDSRLGSEHGIADIKSHPFFSGINWPLIRNTKPPIQVKLNSKTDTCNFFNYNDSSSDEDEVLKEEEENSDSNPFKGFKYQTKKPVDSFNKQ